MRFVKFYSLLGLASIGNLFAYNPPIGIPNPSVNFGWEIDRATPAWPTEWTTPTTTEKTNFYYIDKTAVGATDTNNTYGHPQKPRVHLPEGQLQPGTFIYVHAGTYAAGDSGGARYDWYGSGTSANPIWITGNPTTHPIFQDELQIGDAGSVVGSNASYFIFENFDIVGNQSLVIRGFNDSQDVDHVLVRNVNRVGTSLAADAGGGIQIGGAGTQTSDTTPNSDTSFIVIYNCDIHDVGKAALEPPNGDGSDDHGITIGIHSDHIWMLDNHIYHCGGDSIQGAHNGDYTTKVASNLFIGRNLCHDNGENGVDLKCIQGYVVSQNTVIGPFAREQGWGMVFHYGSAVEARSRNGNVLFNNLHHLSGGIYTSFSAGADNMDIVGNQIYDIKRSYAVTNSNENGAVIFLGGTTPGFNGTFRIANNTFHDYERGIYIESDTGDIFKIHANIFSNKFNAAYYEFESENANITHVTMDYNFYTGTPTFRWLNSSRTLAYMKTTAGQEAHSIVGNPLFVDSSATPPNFHLQAASPAIDAAPEGPVGDSAYAAHLARWGVAIKFDYDGTVRPRDAQWDLGAFESAFPPAAPTVLQVGH